MAPRTNRRSGGIGSRGDTMAKTTTGWRTSRPPTAPEYAGTDTSPGRRRRARRAPPPPSPRVASSCPDQASSFQLEEDLAAQAVAECEVDEGQHCGEQGEGQSYDRERDQNHGRDR